MSADTDRTAYLARVRARLRGEPPPADAPPYAAPPAPAVVDAPLEIAQPSPYSESAAVAALDLSAVADADLVRELARRLAR